MDLLPRAPLAFPDGLMPALELPLELPLEDMDDLLDDPAGVGVG